MKWVCIFTLASSISQATIHPIQFSIPEEKIVREMPLKDQDFAYIVPGDYSKYIFDEEADYYHDYQRSYFGLTCKKGGWDCMRHYEILANGCIPYFTNLESCPPNTMALLPKNLILEAMHLEGVSYPKIDHSKFNLARYYEILDQLIAYTREHLTTRKIAEYLLDTIHYKGQGKILYLTQNPEPDYLRCLTLIGLKQLLGDRIVDVPKIEHIYKNYPGNVKSIYGKGFTYSKNIDDLPIDRSHIGQRILNREFDLIIYGSAHRGQPYSELLRPYYWPNRVVYLCGEDSHRCEYRNMPTLFLREFD